LPRLAGGGEWEVGGGWWQGQWALVGGSNLGGVGRK